MITLPAGWAIATVELLSGQGGLVTDGDWIESKDQDPQGSIRLIQLMDVGEGKFLDRSHRFINNETAERLRCTLLQQGDVLVARMPDPLGRACVFPGLAQGAITAVDVLVWRAGANGAYGPWLVYALNSPEIRSTIEMQAGGTTRQRIAGGRLKALELPVPPLAEQRRIVAKLDALTTRTARARADLDRVPVLAEKERRAVLAAALSGSMTAQWREQHEASWTAGEMKFLSERRRTATTSRRGSRLRQLPPLLLPGSNAVSSWASGCVADVADLLVGYAFKSEWFTEEGPLLMRGANVAVGRVSWGDAKRLRADIAAEYAEYTLHDGDIVLAMDRPLISGGLKIAQCSPAEEGSLLVQRVACPRPSRLADRRYLWWALNSDALVGQIKLHASGSDLPHISSNDILATPIPLPPLPEQVEIARRIDHAFAEIDRLVAEAATARRLLDRLDQAILAKAFRGELVPQDPADESASVLLERIRAERAAATPARAKRGRKPIPA